MQCNVTQNIEGALQEAETRQRGWGGNLRRNKNVHLTISHASNYRMD